MGAAPAETRVCEPRVSALGCRSEATGRQQRFFHTTLAVGDERTGEVVRQPDAPWTAPCPVRSPRMGTIPTLAESAPLNGRAKSVFTGSLMRFSDGAEMVAVRFLSHQEHERWTL